MSVFIRKDTKDGVYSFDFRISNRRFSGSTGKANRREAREVERDRRAEAKAAIAAEKDFSDPNMTLAVATSRYWNEVGQHHRNWKTTARSMAWLRDYFGDATRLADISDEKVAAAVAKRRGEFTRSQRKPGRKYKTPEIRKRVTAATVNRSVTQPLREVILRARTIWKVRTADIRWRNHLLAEPQERVREASPGEENAIMAELARGYDVAAEFAFLTGCRRMEIVGLVWTRVDFFGRQFSVIGKGSRQRTIPMTKRVFEILWGERDRHAETVFTYAAARTVKRGGRLVTARGLRYPITEAGLKTAMRRAVPRAGVSDFHFHDMRHTAATRVLRKSNLKVVQKLLGHQSIETTTKYAHALQEDIRDALEAVAATPRATETATGTRDTLPNDLKELGKAG